MGGGRATPLGGALTGGGDLMAVGFLPAGGAVFGTVGSMLTSAALADDMPAVVSCGLTGWERGRSAPVTTFGSAIGWEGFFG